MTNLFTVEILNRHSSKNIFGHKMISIAGFKESSTLLQHVSSLFIGSWEKYETKESRADLAYAKAVIKCMRGEM